MEEERSRLQEVIAKMEARLSEQTRLLEQVSACRALWVRGGWMMPLPLETLGFGACEWHLSLPCAWTRSGGG